MSRGAESSRKSLTSQAPFGARMEQNLFGVPDGI